MGWYIICWMRIFNYSGKSSRMEYWYFVGLSLVVLSLISIFLLQINSAAHYIYVLVAFNLLPYFSALVRRIRDAGYSPWYVLLHFVPIIGQAVIFYITTRPSCSDTRGSCMFRDKSSSHTVFGGSAGLPD